MKRYTQTYIKNLVRNGETIDITLSSDADYLRIKKEEQRLIRLGYSSGTYGLNGLVLQGGNSGRLYAITCRSSAIFLFY